MAINPSAENGGLITPRPDAAESAMTDICANLERFFAGQQSPEVALAAICQISGRYKMESIK
jgi:hypothetical protein